MGVYAGTTLLKSCPLPSGNGSRWYAFDLSVTGATQTVTCKAIIMRPTSPAPYADQPQNAGGAVVLRHG